MHDRVVVLPNSEFFEETRRLVSEGHSVTFLAMGNSMQPFFRSLHDEIMVERCDKVRLGDVVVARTYEGHYVVHRVVGIEKRRIKLMGDGNISATEYAANEDVIGRIVAYRRRGSVRFKPLYSAKWKAYSLLWTRALPVRKYLLAVYRRVLCLDAGIRKGTAAHHA